MSLKSLTHSLLISLFLTACSSESPTELCSVAPGHAANCNSEDRGNEQESLTESDLSGKTFVDDLGDGQYVIISFNPDKTYSDISNDNQGLKTTVATGSWDITGGDISINLPDESLIFRDAEMKDGQLSFSIGLSAERVSLSQVIAPALQALAKTFIFDDCRTCHIHFYLDGRGEYVEEGDGNYPFSWNYLVDGSVEIDFDGGLGTFRYFFTEVSLDAIKFIGLQDLDDEPAAYLKSGRLLIESDTPAAVDEARVMAALELTNLNENGFPWNGLANGKLKRWDYESSLIPVKTNGSTLAVEALDQIESKLGRTLFDRTSISQSEDNEITYGLIVSEGTALGPGGRFDSNTCGHVSAEKTGTSYPSNFYSADGVIATRLFVNLSSSMCTADLSVAIHEFGHAMGLGSHFEGFGIGPAINADFWDVLYNLYNNKTGTTAEQLNISPVVR